MKTQRSIPGLAWAFGLASMFLIVTAVSSSVYAQTAAQTEIGGAQVKTASAGLTGKVAPGELLPVSIKLSNFGGGGRVDVLVQYEIDDSAGHKIFSTNETVAVETTNNYVKSLPVPLGISAGTYSVKTTVSYQGQVVPATTDFSFQVEPKILGLFRGQFLIYGGVTLLVGLLAIIFGHSLIRHRQLTRLSPLDYSNVPREQRVFYELISDTVMGMRQKVGDRALEVAANTKGIVIDEDTGRIVRLTERPSKVIADLVLGYEKILGKKVSFSFRNINNKKDIKP